VKNLISGVQWIVGLGLIPYAIAALMPSWRWLLGLTLVIGGALSAIWIQDWIVTSDPGYRDGGGGAALGLLFGYIITIAFAAGVGIRTVTLILASKGLPLRHVFTICVAGFAVVPAIFIVPAGWQEWEMRSPSEACSNATFQIDIANANFTIPATPVFIVYLGERSAQDAYYFNMNPSLRSFCRLSDNGKQPVKATVIWLRFGQYRESAPRICTTPVPDWAKTYCTADGSANPKPTERDNVDFPLDIKVFSPNEFRLGDFGGSRSTYEDSLPVKPLPYGSVFITSDTLTTPDQHPLTFECRESGKDYWCKTSYPWSEGASLYYSFQSGRDEIAARGSRIDVETRKFLSGFKAQRRW
jgi:hypothetical protein